MLVVQTGAKHCSVLRRLFKAPTCALFCCLHGAKSRCQLGHTTVAYQLTGGGGRRGKPNLRLFVGCVDALWALVVWLFGSRKYWHQHLSCERLLLPLLLCGRPQNQAWLAVACHGRRLPIVTAGSAASIPHVCCQHLATGRSCLRVCGCCGGCCVSAGVPGHGN